MWVLLKGMGKEKNSYSKTKKKMIRTTHSLKLPELYTEPYSWRKPIPNPFSIKRSSRYNAPRTIGLTLHFSLKLSQMSKMQHSSNATVPPINLTWVSKITDRQCFHMAAAEKVPSRYSKTVPPVTHRFSVEVFLRRYGFSWSSLNF